MTEEKNMDMLCINTMRTLAIDAIQKANSGHPGAPMAMAPVVYALWQRHLRYDPENPLWENRDRFVLSAGHASALLYSILHICDVKTVDKDRNILDRLSVELDDIKNFRQIGSKCPGHPEYGLTAGIETTTGPLGQGAANSVGMAIAGRWNAGHFNKPGFELFEHNVYALAGDGCMMEGITSEAASLAGHLKLPNLCWIYDSNNITIEGSTDIAFTENVGARFKSYGWNVTEVADANDLDALDKAFNNFKNTNDRPTLIIVKSHIAYGSPNKQDKNSAHGEPLGPDEIKLTKENYGWPVDSDFLVPEGVKEHIKNGLGARGKELRSAWLKKFDEYKSQFPELAQQNILMQKRTLPEGWDSAIEEFPADPKGLATRVSSGKVLNMIGKNVPWLIGGSADLAPSTKTTLTYDSAGVFTSDNHSGSNFHFGVREHAMTSIINGMTLSGVRAYGSGFMIFSDYARPAIRLGAMMELPVIHVFTHDSIGVGEDGPTHQPIEHLASLRAMPGLITIRPADANEVIEAWKVVMQLTETPAALALSRQNLPTIDRSKYAPASGLAKGAYVLAGADESNPDIILIATGSEVPLCIDVYEKLKAEGIKARLVSMPSWELFEKQTEEYKDSVLPPSVSARLAVELGSTIGWERYTGLKGRTIGIDTFGASAPLKDLLNEFGFTAEKITAAARDIINKK